MRVMEPKEPRRRRLHVTSTRYTRFFHFTIYSKDLYIRNNEVMPFSKMFGNNNPYGLSGPELASVTNGGNYPETMEARERRLTTDLTVGRARVEKLQRLVARGHTTTEEPSPLDAQHREGGKFALSGPEQAWARGGNPTAPSAGSLSQQLDRKVQQVAAVQAQLDAIQRQSK